MLEFEPFFAYKLHHNLPRYSLIFNMPLYYTLFGGQLWAGCGITLFKIMD